MDVIDYYTSASYIVLEANCTDPTTWRELYTNMRNLHDKLSCQVCHKLLDQPNSYINGVVCLGCVNGQLTDDISSTILKCFKDMCAYIQKSPVYDVMCTRDEDRRLVKLITEVSGICQPTNSHHGLVNGTINKEQQIKEVNNHNKSELNMSSNIQIPTENQAVCINLQLDVQSQKHGIQNRTRRCNIPKKKKTERQLGCQCGSSTTGKKTCFGQRCPCYAEQKSCEGCKCRGCKNPRQKSSNIDDNLKIDQMRRKPVTLELVSSLKPSHIENKPFPSPSQNYEQSGIEISLGCVNSIFHSP